MVFRMIGLTTNPFDAEPGVDTFTDDDTLWGGEAEPYIEGLVLAGVVNGCDPTNRLFCPLRQMTRGEAMAILFRAFQLTVPTGLANPFIDVGDVYYDEAVRAGVGAGLLDVSTPMFRGELPDHAGRVRHLADGRRWSRSLQGKPVHRRPHRSPRRRIPRAAFYGVCLGCRDSLFLFAEHRQQAANRFGVQGDGDGRDLAGSPGGRKVR